MTATQETSTVELSHDGYDDLKNSLKESKSLRDVNKEPDIREAKKQEQRAPSQPSSKKYYARKGDQQFEIDDDFEFEVMADKKPVKMKFRELRERAAGDVAIKNRMHSLAEEKKRVQSTLREFTRLANEDPLGALEFISERAKESDSEFEYQKYLEKLADQAEKLGKMDDKERKSLELEKKLKKAETELSTKERQARIVERKESLLSDYPIDDSQLSDMVEAVLNSDELLAGAENESDVMDRVEELIQETLTQRDIMTVIGETNPKYLNDDNLIFTLSDQIRQNPDLDEADIRDIIRDIIGEDDSRQESERLRDAKTLSRKQRQSAPVDRMIEQNMSPYQLLERQLLERKQELNKTPITMR